MKITASGGRWVNQNSSFRCRWLHPWKTEMGSWDGDVKHMPGLKATTTFQKCDLKWLGHTWTWVFLDALHHLDDSGLKPDTPLTDWPLEVFWCLFAADVDDKCRSSWAKWGKNPYHIPHTANQFPRIFPSKLGSALGSLYSQPDVFPKVSSYSSRLAGNFPSHCQVESGSHIHPKHFSVRRWYSQSIGHMNITLW